jgi:hypothetical protein
VHGTASLEYCTWAAQNLTDDKFRKLYEHRAERMIGELSPLPNSATALKGLQALL